MKRSFIFASILLALSCNTEPKYAKRAHFIFIFDKLNKENFEKLQKAFFVSKAPGGNVLTQYQPDGYDEVSFTVYDAASTAPSPISITFTPDDRKQARKNVAFAYFRKLAADTLSNMDNPDRNLLNTLSSVIENMRDPSAQYTVYFVSSMLENSGGPAGVAKSTDILNGMFRFVTDGKNCNAPDLQEARKQIQGPGWIHHHLVVPANAKGLPAKAKLYLINEIGGGAGRTNGIANCDFEDIKSFWGELFASMHWQPDPEGSPENFLTFQ